jgi:CheY-like chemotaxis protein
MDINMPFMNGFQCTQEIRNLEIQGKLPKTNVISCTTSNIGDCSNVHIFTDHIKKPVRKKNL